MPELSAEGFFMCTFGMMCICSTTFVEVAPAGSSGFTMCLIVSLGMLFVGGGSTSGGGFNGLIVIFGELGCVSAACGSFIIVLIGSRFRLIFSGSTFRLSSDKPMTPCCCCCLEGVW